MSCNPKHLATETLASAQSMASDIVSNVIDIRNADKIFGQIVWTSGVDVSISDKFSLELSNDGVTFAKIYETIMSADASGSVAIDYGSTSAAFARFRFKRVTATAGTASITATVKQ